ncbi:hypothetical protein [Glycomyces sp. TRM65418]|uniref:hypothetical protein n=1 Tax=Glycomyces sp. TRM65418 TaxID=2867006 RepID=UPI0035ABB2D8
MPAKPLVVRFESGASPSGERWQLSPAALGAFLSALPVPMTLGKTAAAVRPNIAKGVWPGPPSGGPPPISDGKGRPTSPGRLIRALENHQPKTIVIAATAVTVVAADNHPAPKTEAMSRPTPTVHEAHAPAATADIPACR